MAKKGPNLDWLLSLFDDILAKGGQWGIQQERNRQAAKAVRQPTAQTESPESIMQRRAMENELRRQEEEMWGAGAEGSANRMMGRMRSGSERVREAEDLMKMAGRYPGKSTISPGYGFWQGESPFLSFWRNVAGGEGGYTGPSVAEMQAYDEAKVLAEEQQGNNTNALQSENDQLKAFLKKLLGGGAGGAGVASPYGDVPGYQDLSDDWVAQYNPSAGTKIGR